jgi:precorrin-2 dehydrogenase/sirohydrochlorin ferrochelatase
MRESSQRFWVPLHLNLKDKPCLFVGGGRVNERRILLMLPSGAKIVLVAPKITPKLKALADSGEIEWRCRAFAPEDAEGAFLAFVAIDGDPSAIVDALRDQGVPVNLASSGKEGDFIVPSVVREGDLVISVSTSGNDPALTKRIAQWLRGEVQRFLPDKL